jgi:hypothetical protein
MMRIRRIMFAAALALGPIRYVSAQNAAPTPPPTPGAPGAPADGPTFARNAEKSAPAALAEAGEELTAYFSVPEMPASTILGVTPASITRPITPKDFASTIIQGIDPSGRVQQGIALEGSLALFRAFRVPLSTYQRSRRARFWSNLLVSLATARVASDTQSTDLAWGVRAPLYDDGDPMARPAYTSRLGAALLTCAPDKPPLVVPRTDGKTRAQIQAEADSTVAANKLLMEKSRAETLSCLEGVATETGKAAADSLWNAARLVLAYAGSTRLAQSALRDRRRLEDRVWLVGSMPLSRIAGPIPFARSSQAIGYVDYVRRHASDSAVASNGASYGARLNIGRATLNAFGEVLGEWRDQPAEGVKGNSVDFSGGLEFLAAAGTWISTGVGRRYTEVLKADKTVLLLNIRWGISSKSFLGAGPDSSGP